MAHRNTEVIDRLIELDQATRKRILVVGDGMTDVYVHGWLEAECQEGCQKFVEVSRVVVPGGARNAARSLKHWNADVVYVGDDHCGPVKTRFMVDDQCVFRYDEDSIKFDRNLVLNEITIVLTQGSPDAVLISDYDKGLLTPKYIKGIIEWCNDHNIPCVADCKQSPSVYRGALMKFNSSYDQHWDVLSGEEVWKAVCTNGASTPYTSRCLRIDGCSHHPVKMVNHVGAGDCFAVHLTLALAHGFKLEDAAVVAHSAGRVYVQYLHNRPPYPHEVKADMCGEPTLQSV